MELPRFRCRWRRTPIAVTPILVGVPIKPFGVAKARLAPVLGARARARLGMEIAAHTLETVAASGGVVVVVTGDHEVARWAQRQGWRVVGERPGGGLDGAGAALAAAAGDDPWGFVHADLPLLAVSDLGAVWEALDRGTVLAPSHDGGTSAIASRGRFPFSSGPGSFRRHLAAAPTATVVTRPGLALDLDTARDLAVARSLPAGRWLPVRRRPGVLV